MNKKLIWPIVGVIVIIIGVLINFKVNKINDDKMFESVTKQVIEILKDNKEIEELIGDNYEVFCYSKRSDNLYSLICQGEENNVIVDATLNSNNEVEKIDILSDEDGWGKLNEDMS